MKLFQWSLVICAIAKGQGLGEERKVPPQKPHQRLGTLARFLDQWIDRHMGAQVNRKGRADVMKDNFKEKIVDKFQNAWERPCAGGDLALNPDAYKDDPTASSKGYNPTWENGGPNPNGKNQIKWKDYRKLMVGKLKDRQAKKEAEKLAKENGNVRRRRATFGNARVIRDLSDIPDHDIFDQYFQSLESGTNVRNSELELQRAIDTVNAGRGLEQIQVGFMKWAFRYLSECNGEIDDKSGVRLADFAQMLDTTFADLAADQEIVL